MKQFLTDALVLKIFDLDKEFLVCTNDFKRGLGGILMQEGHVVCYESRILNGHEQNYVTHDIELEVIKNALKMWKHYIFSMKFI